MHGRWDEVGDRVWVGRYAFLDQSIGVVAGDGETLVVDTRASDRHAREVLEDLVAIGLPRPSVAVDSHHHWDHAFGNAAVRPAAVWGHARCVARLRAELRRRDEILASWPEMARDWPTAAVDEPDRTFEETAYVDVGGRPVELRHLGRGHTDDDVVVFVPDAGVAFAGDLLENGGPPYFGDGYPLDWPETVSRILERMGELVVPGHGDPGNRRFAEDQLDAFLAIAELSRRVARGELGIDAAAGEGPYDAAANRAALERGVAQVAGLLD
jgi:glyoxylase-like metal-dependent hydrolase (beta-lactamase superfamily II)